MCDDSSASRSKNTFIVIGEREESKSLNKSFAELNILSENQEQRQTYVWSFVRNLQSRPYETTLQTFSKLTDVICEFSIFILIFIFQN